MERQLSIGGYRTRAGVVQDVKVSDFQVTRGLDANGARVFLGLDAGLLRTLRDFGAGPEWERVDGKVIYSKHALVAWKEEISGPDAHRIRDIRACLAELCEFWRIERKRVRISDEWQVVGHPRVVDDGRNRRRDIRVNEVDLFAAAGEWFRNARGCVPRDLDDSHGSIRFGEISNAILDD